MTRSSACSAGWTEAAGGRGAHGDLGLPGRGGGRDARHRCLLGPLAHDSGPRRDEAQGGGVGMSGDRFDVLERFTPLFDDSGARRSSGSVQRRDRQRRRRRIAAGVAGTAWPRPGCRGWSRSCRSAMGRAPHRPDLTIAVSEGSAGQTTSTSTAPAERVGRRGRHRFRRGICGPRRRCSDRLSG